MTVERALRLKAGDHCPSRKSPAGRLLVDLSATPLPKIAAHRSVSIPMQGVDFRSAEVAKQDRLIGRREGERCAQRAREAKAREVHDLQRRVFVQIHAKDALIGTEV